MTTQLRVNAKEHPIVGVTVYQTDRAVVQRRFSVEVKAGQNDIVIGRLPLVLEGDSLRVEAETKSRTQAITVFDVIYVPASYAIITNHSPEIEALNEQKGELDARLDAIKGQKAIMEGYSESLQSGRIQDVTTEKLESFMEVYANKQVKIHEEKAKLKKEIKEVAKKLEEIRKKEHDGEEEKRSSGVTVVLLAEEAGSVDLMLSYVVHNASWSSLYDVRADLASTSGNSKDAESGPSVKLQYRANITQSTGEDWTGVALTLSTASPLTGSDIPKVEPWRITAYRAIVRPATMYRRSLSSTAQASPGGPYGMPAMAMAAPPPPAPAMMLMQSSALTMTPENETAMYDAGPNINIREGAISSTFGIDGLSTIPSDHSEHKVSIATIDLSADLEWITVPRTLPSAFLQCRIKNKSSYQLIAGPSSVFLDGNFVSKSQVPDVSPQESFTCSLGVDPSVRITYHPQSKVSSTAGGGLMSTKTKVTAFKQRITIKNTRAASIARLVVQDRIPVSEDSRIKVTVHQPSEKAIGPVAGPGSSSHGGTSTSSSLGASALSKNADQVLVEKISKNVVARWAQKEEEDGGSGGARGDGVIEWIATELTDTLDLNLSYDVSAPIDVRWVDA